MLNFGRGYELTKQILIHMFNLEEHVWFQMLCLVFPVSISCLVLWSDLLILDSDTSHRNYVALMKNILPSTLIKVRDANK